MKKIFLIGLLLLGLIGCGNTPIKTGVLTTPGITIEAIDGSFTIKSGEVFKTPFDIGDACVSGFDDKYEDHLNNGAKKVKINFDDGSHGLFGVIQFCMRHDSGTHYTTSDQHIIQIPNKYIKLARNGRKSKVYQRIGIGLGAIDGGLSGVRNIERYGWILWLSNKPF